MPKMKAAIFVEPGRIVLDEKPIVDSVAERLAVSQKYGWARS
jgi:hypothetical protein